MAFAAVFVVPAVEISDRRLSPVKCQRRRGFLWVQNCFFLPACAVGQEGGGGCMGF
jgi:hypothetical protein